MTTGHSHIYGIVERWATQTPDREALVSGSSRWTWAELDRRVRRAAGALRSAGIGPGDRFAVLDKNHPATLELTLAASLIGATAAVINFRLVAAELAYVLNDSSALLLVAGSEFVPAVRTIRAKLPELREVVVLGGDADEYESWVAAAEPIGEPHASAPDDCFLQLYTSGTTGWPKGAMLTQRSMTAHTDAVAPAYGMDGDSINIVAMPLFHVGGTSWALGSMSVGARTVVVREAQPQTLFGVIESERATHAFLVPTVIQMLLDDPERARSALATLRVLGYGGSPMPTPLLERTLSTLPTPLYSVYGMTELSGVCCVLGPDEHRDEQRADLRSSVGKPLPGNEIRIVDPATGGDLALGAVGEFWVHSDQRMAGYWNLPQATRDAVTEDGWLRTGDVGRQDEQGYLYLVDRLKDMIITGGENVYPAEIERVIQEYPGVVEAAVIGVPDEKWGETVRAVVVSEGGGHVDEQALIAFSRNRLAHYKCPTSVVSLSALPRNASGKILKRELRDHA